MLRIQGLDVSQNSGACLKGGTRAEDSLAVLGVHSYTGTFGALQLFYKIIVNIRKFITHIYIVTVR